MSGAKGADEPVTSPVSGYRGRCTRGGRVRYHRRVVTITYEVKLVGFPRVPTEEATEALAKVFKITTSEAEQFIRRAPVSVREGVDEPRARRFAGTLIGIGADVRVICEQTGHLALGPFQAGIPRPLEEGSTAPTVPSAPAAAASPLFDPASEDSTCRPLHDVPTSKETGPIVNPSQRVVSFDESLHTTLLCPKCFLEQPRGGESCLECGVLFAKARPR